MYKLLNTILVLVFFSVAALYALQKRTNNRLHAEQVTLIARLEEKNQGGSRLQERRKKSLQRTLQRLPGKSLGETGVEANDMTNAALSLMKEPAIKDLMQQQQVIMAKAQVEKQYGAFFKNVLWPEEQKDKLRALLVDRQVKPLMLSMEWTNMSLENKQKNLSPDGLLQMNREVKEKRTALDKEMEAELAAFLGAEYPKFQQYQATLPQRVIVSDYEENWERQGVKLDPSSQEKLVSLLYEENGAVVVPEFAQNSPSPEALKQTVEQLNASHERLLTKAQSILPPEQYELFVAEEERRLRRQLHRAKYPKKIQPGMPADLFGFRPDR